MRSYSNSKLHPTGFPSRFMLDFPDPLDVSQIHKTALQWSHRAYCEAKDCFEKGGFVLFDTLTYDDDHLKYFHDVDPSMKFIAWDYPCFFRSDIQNFMKLLRKRLHYLGFDVDRNLRYLITSEYGSSEGCTHRPHYHCLFFVTFDIDPLFLSSMIHAAWPSIHDGYPDKPRLYVQCERVFRSCHEHSLNVFNYVCKYISKDLYTYRKLTRRAFAAFSIAYPNWLQSATLRKEFRRFKSQVLNFHLQSLHFGDSALKDVESLKRGYFCFYSNKKVLQVPLCTTFERKVYYHQEIINGQIMWRRNNDDDSIQYFWRKFQKSVSNLALNLHLRFPELDEKKCKHIAEYQLLNRGLLVPDSHLGLSTFDMFKSVYFSELPKEMLANYFHKRISFADFVFFGVSGAFITNYVLRDVFRYKYKSNKNNIITSRTTDPPRCHRCRVRGIVQPIPIHQRVKFRYNTDVCPPVYNSVHRPERHLSLSPMCLSLDEFVQSPPSGYNILKNRRYDKIIDTYLDELNEIRSLRKNDEFDRQRLRYAYKSKSLI